MDQVVLKLHNLPEQSRILANGITAEHCPSIRDLFEQAYQADPLPGEILKAIREKGSLKGIAIAESSERNAQVWYRGKCSLPEGDQLR
jgi:hypothetical protein